MQINGMPDTNGMGVGVGMAQSLNPGYSNMLFNNIQQAQAGLKRQNRQQVMDNTGRFGQMGSGMQQQLLAQGNQGIADSTLKAAGAAATQGAQANQQNQQFNQGLQFQAQNAANQLALQKQQMSMSSDEFNQERQDARTAQLMNLMGGAMVGMGKMGFA